MNHQGLFIKLMERGLSEKVLLLLENWFNIGVTCVKWGTVYSAFFCYDMWHTSSRCTLAVPVCGFY